MPPADEPPAWGAYYAADYTLPRIHEHLGHMQYLLSVCRQHFGGSRVLEAGTGTGLLAIYLSQEGFNVYGLDYDPDVLNLNRELNARFGGMVKLTRGDMFALPFPDHSLDAIYHQGLLEHFDEGDIVRALSEHTRVAKRVIFTVPTVRWKGGLRGDERLWTGRTWHALLQDFAVADVFGSAYSALLPRALHAVERRLPRLRAGWLYRPMALGWAGEIGFVLTRSSRSG